jgi:hypothetical protein
MAGNEVARRDGSGADGLGSGSVDAASDAAVAAPTSGSPSVESSDQSAPGPPHLPRAPVFDGHGVPAHLPAHRCAISSALSVCSVEGRAREKEDTGDSGLCCRLRSGETDMDMEEEDAHDSAHEHGRTGRFGRHRGGAGQDYAKRLCPVCDHDFTKCTVRATGARRERWACLCKTIKTCKDCPVCKARANRSSNCACPARDDCACGKAATGGERICVSASCPYVLTY